ncbi:MAG: class I fructose-bisphosphate aldolase [Cyanobacteria bacterium P01_F01_bin.42]
MSSYEQELRATAKAMVAPGKGLLAIDESNGTCNKRFEKLGIATTEENRRAYRELILTTPNLADYVSGYILYDETIRQKTKEGKSFVDVIKDAGQIPGIKVDTGAKDFSCHPNEKMTEGLDGLRERIAEYYAMGARFAKWRAVITIGDGIPSAACIEGNAHGLARYASLCQEGGLVPIVEPEVLIDGDHTLERCFEVTDLAQKALFSQLHLLGVEFDQMILKPSMVISGKQCAKQATVEEVAEATIKCLRKNVPASVAGVAFLSGGQGNEQAAAHLNLMNSKYSDICPWPVTFSYARAIQQPALDYWSGDASKVEESQKRLLHRAKCNSAASQGTYTAEMERQPVAA